MCWKVTEEYRKDSSTSTMQRFERKRGYFRWQVGKTKSYQSYPGQYDKYYPEDQTGMDSPRQTMKYRAQRVNKSPERKHDDPTKRDSVVDLMAGIERLYHGDIEGS